MREKNNFLDLFAASTLTVLELHPRTLFSTAAPTELLLGGDSYFDGLKAVPGGSSLSFPTNILATILYVEIDKRSLQEGTCLLPVAHVDLHI